MNLLSCGALITAVLYVMLMVRIYTGSQMDKLNFWSLLVCASLCWWSFCDVFFYSAATEKSAWFWHHLSAIGWCGFIPVTVYYFLIMTHKDHKLNTPLRQICYWILPFAMIVYSLCKEPTPLAEDLVLSKSGLGWTFVQSFSTPLPYLYLLMVGCYFISGFVLLYRTRSGDHKVDIHQLALGFIVLDIVSILTGILTVYIIPYFTDYLPPMSFMATLIFLIGYRYELWGFDLMHIEFALDPSSVFESSLNAILITDEKFCILYTNNEAKRLMGSENLIQKDFGEYVTPDGREQILCYSQSGDKELRTDMDLLSGIPVICSINRSKTRKHLQNIFVIFLNDISPLRMAQTKLHYLAHYDELTGLPNRRRLRDLLDEWAVAYNAGNCDFELLFLDLNNFKSINDKFGHQAGDLALKSVAEALESIRGEKDVVARLSGDEFIILHQLSENKTSALPEKICLTLEQIDCQSFAPGHTLSAAMGQCRFSEASSNVRNLFKMADERMYKAKNRGRK